MNETNLTPRQSHILNIINQSEGLLREEIGEAINNMYHVSKPTLVRDLNILIKTELIKTEGRGKTTYYLSVSKNPLFRVFDINKYFSLEPDQRTTAKKMFDFKVFDYLNDPALENEFEILKNQNADFGEKTKNLSPDLIKRELERFTIELSWKSSKIEGNTYTLLETESLIKDQKEAKGKSKAEAIMILNHKNAFELILNNKDDFKTLTTSIISQLHNTLIKGLEISSGVRKNEVGITGTIYKPLGTEHQLKEALEKAVMIINNTENAYEKALIANIIIPYIQPYTDGNKRTARMLGNAILLANNLLPLSYRSVDEEQFKKALILFYEQLSLVGITKIFIDQVRFANENYF